MKLIPKHQNGKPIKKLNWFTNATLNAAMADNPAIMTSAGWNIDSSTGEVKQDNKAFEAGSPEENLRNNLAVTSTFAPTHPLNAVFEMAPWIYRGGLYALGKAGNIAAKNRYFATTLNDIVKETELATHEPILNVGWGPSLTIIGTHASNKPVTKFVPFNRWDVKNHKADPYGYFVTEGLSAGIMSERPVLQIINVELKKPMVQVGEVGKSGINKNTSRNLLIRQARNLGADGYIMQDIADNKADHLNIIFKFIDREGESPILFLSELDWNNWLSNDATIFDKKSLRNHIPEYLEIERKAKENRTWLKGWYGDPRSWVLLQSRAAQKLKPEVFWTGIRNETIDPNYNGVLWGVQHESFPKLAAAKASTYASKDDNILQMIFSKNSNIKEFNANGKSWYKLGETEELRTNDIVENAFNNGYDIVKIKDVSDTGPYTHIKKHSFNTPEDRLADWEIVHNPGVTQDDIILNKGTVRKSLIGNNGNFDINNKSIFRLSPLLLMIRNNETNN